MSRPQAERNTLYSVDASKTPVSQQFLEYLLTSFLGCALGLELHQRVDQIEILPALRRQSIEAIASDEVAWVAWDTSLGLVATTGEYDTERSYQLNAHILLIEWWIPPDTHHVSWWRADTKRPGEWTAGRGRNSGSIARNEKG